MRDWIMMLSFLTMALIPVPALAQERLWDWGPGILPGGGCGAPEEP